MEALSLIAFGAIMYIVLIGIPSMVEIMMEPCFGRSLDMWFGSFKLHSFGR